MTAGGSSLPEVQQLLRVLAAGRRAAEVGTAFGEGAAAIADTGASLVTVERDEERAALARDRLASFTNIELIVGDWHDLLPARGRFEFLFFDGGSIEPQAVDLLERGGLLIKDDMTPGRRIAGDPVRELLFGHPELLAAEVTVRSDMAVIVVARR